MYQIAFMDIYDTGFRLTSSHTVVESVGLEGQVDAETGKWDDQLSIRVSTSCRKVVVVVKAAEGRRVRVGNFAGLFVPFLELAFQLLQVEGGWLEALGELLRNAFDLLGNAEQASEHLVKTAHVRHDRRLDQKGEVVPLRSELQFLDHVLQSYAQLELRVFQKD